MQVLAKVIHNLVDILTEDISANANPGRIQKTESDGSAQQNREHHDAAGAISALQSFYEYVPTVIQFYALGKILFNKVVLCT